MHTRINNSFDRNHIIAPHYELFMWSFDTVWNVELSTNLRTKVWTYKKPVFCGKFLQNGSTISSEKWIESGTDYGMARNTIGILILIFTWTKYSQANDFPSLLVANATMGTYFFLNSHCMQHNGALCTTVDNSFFTQFRCDNWSRVSRHKLWKNIWIS